MSSTVLPGPGLTLVSFKQHLHCSTITPGAVVSKAMQEGFLPSNVGAHSRAHGGMDARLT